MSSFLESVMQDLHTPGYPVANRRKTNELFTVPSDCRDVRGELSISYDDSRHALGVLLTKERRREANSLIGILRSQSDVKQDLWLVTQSANR